MVPGEVVQGFSDADLGFTPSSGGGGNGTPVPDKQGGYSDEDLGFTGQESPPVMTRAPDPDKTDYGAMPWTEAAKRGVMSTPAALESGAKTAYKLVTNPIQTAQGLYDLGHGVVSHVNRWAYDLPPDDQSNIIEAPINEAAKENWENWSSAAGIKKHIATNLPGTLLDVSTLAGGLGGVAGTAAKVADPLGAITKLADTAGAVAERTNPLTGFGALNDITKTRAPALVDQTTGQAHPTVDAAIKGATDQTHNFQSLYGDGDAAAQKAFADTIQAKGANVNAAKEGILNSVGMTPTRTAVTGEEAASDAAKQAAIHAAQDNEIKATGALKSIVGDPDNTDIHGIAKALDQARVDSLNKAVAPLERAKQDTGYLDGSMGGPKIMSAVSRAASSAGAPVHNIQNLSSYPNAAMAIGEIQKTVPGPWVGDNPLTAQSLMNLRSSISKLARTATGSDQHVTGAIVDAFDNHIVDAVQKGKWVGGNAQQFLNDMQQGRAAYAQHMSTFHDRGGNNGTIASVTKPMSEEEVGGGLDHAPGLGDDTYQSIQQKLSSALSNDSNKADTLTRLQNIFAGNPDAQSALQSYMRRKVMFDPKSGGIAAPEKINQALTKHGHIADRLFTPQEQAQITRINAARAINSGRTKIAKPESLLRTLRKAGTEGAVKFGMAKAAGTFGMPGGEILGWLGGEGINSFGNHLGNLRSLKNELKGAPAHRTLGSRVKGAGRYAAGALTSPLAGQLGANANLSNNLIPARADGGSVNSHHDRLVSRLMLLAENAKKEEKKATKSILGLPDDTVTAALAKANEATQT